jgi:hypothetical protein
MLVRVPALPSRLFFAVLSFIVASVLAPSIRAQQPNPPDPECKAADLDARFAFAKTADHQELVALEVRNISESTCSLGGGGGAMFNDSKQGHNIWTKECFDCTPAGKPNPEPYERSLALPPGGEAYRVYRWTTISTDVNSPCQDADWINTYINSDMYHGYLIIAPAFITKVCSSVQVSVYRLGSFVGSKPGESIPAEESREVKLTADKQDNFVGELIALHVDASNDGAPDRNSCLHLFVRVRSEKGETRFEEQRQPASCSNSAETPPNDTGRKEDLIRTDGFGMAAAGDYTIEVSELAGFTSDGIADMVTSNTLHLHFADASTLRREWSPLVRGLGIALNLDQREFPLGQDIHLHAALEDFKAKPVIFRADCSRPVTFQVFDARGQLIPSKGITPGYPTLELITCHGGRSQAFAKGEPIPLESTLREWGILPDHAGEYTLVATWNALSESEGPPPPDAIGKQLEVYAVVRSQPISFRIVAANNP